jgi:hypothetical protein
MQNAARKEAEDRELLKELEALDPDMHQQLVVLVKTVAGSSVRQPKGPLISAAGRSLLAALYTAAEPDWDVAQCAPILYFFGIILQYVADKRC